MRETNQSFWVRLITKSILAYTESTPCFQPEQAQRSKIFSHAKSQHSSRLSQPCVCGKLSKFILHQPIILKQQPKLRAKNLKLAKALINRQKPQTRTLINRQKPQTRTLINRQKLQTRALSVRQVTFFLNQALCHQASHAH